LQVATTYPCNLQPATLLLLSAFCLLLSAFCFLPLALL
jgi:hypothetical protein